MIEPCSAKQSSQKGLKLLASHELNTVLCKKECYMYKNGPLKQTGVIALFKSIIWIVHQIAGTKHWQSVLSTSPAPSCCGKMAIAQKCFEENVKIQKLGLFISGKQCNIGTVF